MAGEDVNPESAHDLSHRCPFVSLWWLLSQVEPMEYTKKLLYQYEAMMQLKNDEKLSRHQAWESELEVGFPGGGEGGCLGARWQGWGVEEVFIVPLPHFPNQVLEILKLREEEEEAHMLTVSIYDTKRNSKSKEHREAMVSLSPCPRSPWSPG